MNTANQGCHPLVGNFKHLYCLFLVLLSLVLLSQPLVAQNGRPAVAGARGLGMGNLSLAYTDIQAAFGHQAGLVGLKKFSAAAFGERRFALSQLGSYSAAAALPVNSGVFALNLNYFGFEDYNEQKIGLAYARKLMDKLSIGLQVNYLNTRIPSYGSKSVFTFELSFLSQLTPKFAVAGHLYSPARVALAEDEDLPAIFKLGLSYRPSAKLLLAGEIVKQVELPISVRSGLEYGIYEALFLRIGIMTAPSQLTFGFGFALKNGLKLDISSAYHSILGFSPAFGLSYQID